jgi:hypothetical protein
MTFFNFSPDPHSGPQVSKWLWLYAAITIPLTSIIYVAWKFWIRKGRRRGIEREYLSGDIELGSVESQSRTDKDDRRNVFWELKYWDPSSRPADVEEEEVIWK